MYPIRHYLQLARLGKRRYAEALRPVEQKYGLTRNEIDVILFLANNPAHDTARDMVEMRSLTKSHVCKSVDSLTRRGFLSGRQDRQDRRCVHLTLLPAAAPAVQDARQAQKRFFQRLTRGSTPAEEQMLEQILERLLHNLKEESE